MRTIRSYGSRLTLRRARWGALTIGAIFAVLGPRADAAGGTIQDGAVALTYPSAHWGPAPLANLTGVEPSPNSDVLFHSGWWYRVEGDTREYPLPPPDSETYADGIVSALWNNVDGKDLKVFLYEYVVDHEGPSGGFWSRVLAINHGGTRTVKLFHYLDVDAAGLPPNDLGQPLTSAYMEQTEVGGTSIVRYRAPRHFHSSTGTSCVMAVGLYPSLLNLLNDSDADDIFPSLGAVGPGDVTALYEFGATLQPGVAMEGIVSVYANMPSRSVKGAVPDFAPYPALVYFDTQIYRAQLMRGTRMVPELNYPVQELGLPVGVDDFDGDYTNDALYRDTNTGALRIDLDPVASPPPLNWVVAATGDFDADGKADILWRNNTSQKLSVWFMNGTTHVGSQAPNPDHAVDANWNAVGTGDFNADGLRDLLWYNQTTGKLVIWYLNGALQRTSGGFTDPPSVGDNNWRVVAVGDYGKGATGGTFPPAWNAVDIVWQNDNSYRLVVWFMDAFGRRTSGTFTTPDAFGTWQNVVGPR